MMNRDFLSLVIIFISLIIAGVLSYVVFISFDKVWFELFPMICLSMIAFGTGIAIWIGALLLEKNA